MYVPDPVISFSVDIKDRTKEATFSKALTRFAKEDPTFKVTIDEESGTTMIAGMGELHLNIYTERMKREYDLDVITGKPYVAYRETISKRVSTIYHLFSNVFRQTLIIFIKSKLVVQDSMHVL